MHTKESITHLLETRNDAVERAILRLYSFQTAQEQSIQTTRDQNGVGFSAADGHTGSYYAKWIKSGKHLSGKHLIKARSMVLKYTRQLLEFANKPVEEQV